MTDYEQTYNSYQIDVPEFFNFTTDVFEKWARDPQRVAVVIADAKGEKFQQFTFAQLSSMANQFAQSLLRQGCKKSDRVIVILPKIHQWYVALLAMFKLGIIPVPTTSQSTSRDILYRIEKADAIGVITDLQNAPKIDDIAEQCPSLKFKYLVCDDKKDFSKEKSNNWLSFHQSLTREKSQFTAPYKTRSTDPLLIYFTSGTVSYPKMVLHTQEYAIAHEVTSRFWHDLHPEDLHWTMSDTGWAKAAWGCLFGQWKMGARIFLHNSPRFDPKITLKLLETACVTTFCAPPTVYRIFAQEDLSRYNFKTLRHCTSAGEPLNPEVIKTWKEATSLTIHDGYGQTETVNVVANYRCLPYKQGSMGKPAPGFKLAVIDAEGNELPTDKEGMLAIRCRPNRPAGLFSCYYKDEETTKGAFIGDWYLTGDKAKVDDDGYFWFIARNDDVIITSGYRIGPFEVESVLLEHPAVMESAVVASPDPVRGEIVKAFIILSAGYEPCPKLIKELQQHVRKLTAPYKYPRKIEFVEELPKTISGKIRRGELRDKEWQNHSARQ